MIKPFFSQDKFKDTQDILSIYQLKKDNEGEIKQGMSPKEMAEISSENLIKIIRENIKK